MFKDLKEKKTNGLTYRTLLEGTDVITWNRKENEKLDCWIELI